MKQRSLVRVVLTLFFGVMGVGAALGGALPAAGVCWALAIAAYYLP